MFITNLKKDFYEKLCSDNCRVLLLVAQDVDALCACRILQCLFQCDNILYTLIPVSDRPSLREAYQEHSDQIKYVVMINCGGTFDVVNFFNSEGVTFFIVDSHRPIDVYNIYNGSEVRLLMKENDEDGVPKFDDLFREDDSDEDELEITEERIERRSQRRKWEEKRRKLLFEYTQFSHNGPASAVSMFDLAWKLSKDTNQLLWWAIVGLTEQYVKGLIEVNQYILDVGNIQGHVSRHNQKGIDENRIAVDCLKIEFDNELQLSLYRHWSLFESVKHTMYTACNFKLWTLKGQKKMYSFLAELGLPIVQCKQKFSNMDIHVRNNVKDWIEDASEKYDLQKITYGSFTIHYGYRNKFNAMDVVRACNALLESTDRDKTQDDRFLNALDCLSKEKTLILERGIELAKFQLIAIFKQVQSLLDMHQIISAGPFLYASLQDGCPDARYFTHLSCLRELARFLLSAHVSVSRSKKAKNMPLVLMAPHAHQEGEWLVVGIPPLSEDSPRNFFGKAFEQVSLRMKTKVSQNNFDLSTLQIQSQDKTKFFDALISLLS